MMFGNKLSELKKTRLTDVALLKKIHNISCIGFLAFQALLFVFLALGALKISGTTVNVISAFEVALNFSHKPLVSLGNIFFAVLYYVFLVMGGRNLVKSIKGLLAHFKAPEENVGVSLQIFYFNAFATKFLLLVILSKLFSSYNLSTLTIICLALCAVAFVASIAIKGLIASNNILFVIEKTVSNAIVTAVLTLTIVFVCRMNIFALLDNLYGFLLAFPALSEMTAQACVGIVYSTLLTPIFSIIMIFMVIFYSNNIWLWEEEYVVEKKDKMEAMLWWAGIFLGVSVICDALITSSYNIVYLLKQSRLYVSFVCALISGFVVFSAPDLFRIAEEGPALTDHSKDEIVGGSKTIEAPEATEAPEVPEATEAPEVSEAPETTDAE